MTQTALENLILVLFFVIVAIWSIWALMTFYWRTDNWFRAWRYCRSMSRWCRHERYGSWMDMPSDPGRQYRFCADCGWQQRRDVLPEAHA